METAEQGEVMAMVAAPFEVQRVSMRRVFERAFDTVLHKPVLTIPLAEMNLFGG